MYIAAIIVILLLGGMLVSLLVESIPAIRHNGLGFITNTVWNPVKGNYGALPFILGTLITSFIALFVSLPFSMAVSILLSEYLKKGPVAAFLRTAIDLLAGVPSIIVSFGEWEKNPRL